MREDGVVVSRYNPKRAAKAQAAKANKSSATQTIAIYKAPDVAAAAVEAQSGAECGVVIELHDPVLAAILGGELE